MPCQYCIIFSVGNDQPTSLISTRFFSLLKSTSYGMLGALKRDLNLKRQESGIGQKLCKNLVGWLIPCHFECFFFKNLKFTNRPNFKNSKVAHTRVGEIPGYFYYPGTGIPGYFRKNTRVYPGIQNPLHKKQKSSLMSWKMHWFDVFWPYFIFLWTYSSKNIDKNFTKKFWKKFLIL